MLERFQLERKGTDVKTELMAGLTTFLTMMYIVPVNGFIMADAGLPMERSSRRRRSSPSSPPFSTASGATPPWP